MRGGIVLATHAVSKTVSEKEEEKDKTRLKLRWPSLGRCRFTSPLHYPSSPWVVSTAHCLLSVYITGTLAAYIHYDRYHTNRLAHPRCRPDDDGQLEPECNSASTSYQAIHPEILQFLIAKQFCLSHSLPTVETRHVSSE